MVVNYLPQTGQQKLFLCPLELIVLGVVLKSMSYPNIYINYNFQCTLVNQRGCGAVSLRGVDHRGAGHSSRNQSTQQLT